VVWAYGDGRSLVCWRSDAGRALGQNVTAASGGDFTSVNVPFVMVETGTGASAVRIAARFIQRPAHASIVNVGGTLTTADTARLALFTGARADLLAAASAPAPPSPLTQTGAITGSTGSRRFYRVRQVAVDSDADGQFDHVELTAACPSNPFATDTDFDGLSDSLKRASEPPS
jgi:hypothetical protein